MKNRSKMILGLASLLGVTAGATAVSGFAWFVTTKTANIDVTHIGVYNNNPSLSVNVTNMKGVVRTNNAANDFDLKAANDTSDFMEEFDANGTATYVLSQAPLAQPKAYVDGVEATVTSYDAGTKTVTLSAAPEAGKKVRFVYCDKAALTDVSSKDGINFYDPTWQAAHEGTKATKIPAAVAGEQYITFDMVFTAPTTGSLNVFLDRPTITPLNNTNEADNEAAAVTRVAFSTDADGNVLTISNNVSADYKKGISKDLIDVPHADTTAGDYTVTSFLEDCENLVVPSETNYSVLSSVADLTAANNYITTINGSNVTVHVAIWLEGTSHVDALTGNNSTPIGGEINVRLPIVAFGA